MLANIEKVTKRVIACLQQLCKWKQVTVGQATRPRVTSSLVSEYHLRRIQASGRSGTPSTYTTRSFPVIQEYAVKSTRKIRSKMAMNKK